MTDQPGSSRQPTEEELRAAWEAEMKRVRVEDVFVQTFTSLINLGARKAGLAPGSEDERDLPQVALAIDAVRALMPVAEPVLGPNVAPLREAISQLQLAYARIAGGEDAGAELAEPGAGGPGEAPPPAAGAASEGPASPGEADASGANQPGPAQRSGRLWVPGQ